MTEPEPEYELVMPFIACQSMDGPYDDKSFAAGIHVGQLMERLDRDPFQLRETVPSALVPQLDLLAMQKGYVMSSTPWPASPIEWSFVTFDKP
jgi:hypothetical protein